MDQYLEQLGMSLLKLLTFCIWRQLKKHVEGESNFLTDKSKSRKKVMCQKYSIYRIFFHFKYMITVPFFLMEAYYQ